MATTTRGRVIREGDPALIEAFAIVRTLTGMHGCDAPGDKVLCRLFQSVCFAHAGRLPVGVIALEVAALVVEAAAAASAMAGDVKTLTITTNGSRSAEALLAVANVWRQRVADCVREMRPKARIVATRTADCLRITNGALSACGCEKRATAVTAVVVTRIECCDDC